MTSDYYRRIDDSKIALKENFGVDVDDKSGYDITVTKSTEQDKEFVGKDNSYFSIITDTYIPQYKIITYDVYFGEQFLVLGSSYVGDGNYRTLGVLFTSRASTQVNTSKLKRGVKYAVLGDYSCDTEKQSIPLPFYTFVKELFDMYTRSPEINWEYMMEVASVLLEKAGKNAFQNPRTDDGRLVCLGVKGLI